MPTPRATDLVCGPPPPLPPPTVIAHQLAQTHHLAVGIDIETHILVPGNTKVWAEGQFGFKTTIDPDSITAMRLIEIGFAIGDCHGGDPIAQSCVIRPDGFMVSCEATRVHHISHGDAVQDGIPLKDALELMVTRVLEAVSAGHRIVSHHLEFDAGIIAAEFVHPNATKRFWVTRPFLGHEAFFGSAATNGSRQQHLQAGTYASCTTDG